MHKVELVFKPESKGSSYGFVCVRSTYHCTNDPILIVNFWKVSERVYRKDAEAYYPEIADGRAIALTRIDSAWYRFHREPMGKFIDVHIIGGGSTRSFCAEEIPIPPPRVRKGTAIQYRNGFWLKYSKREGWIMA